MKLFGRKQDVTAANLPAPLSTVPIASPWAPAGALEVATWAGLLDQLDQMPVTRSQAIKLPAVARGRDLIAVSVARFPIYAVTAAGRLAQQPRICQQPEPGRARFTTMCWTVDSLIFEGVAWWLVMSRYFDGRPQTVRWVPPAEAEVDSFGNLVRAFGLPIDPRDVIRFDGPHEGFLRRGSETVRDARRLAVRYARACDTPTPDVELHQTGGEPLSDTDVDKLIAQWVAARRGENGGVAYTNESIEAKYNGQQPEQLLVSGRDAMTLDIARHLNLPAWAVDAQTEGSSLTYSNVPSRGRELIDYTLAGYIEAITGRLSLDDVLPAGTWAVASTDVLTDGDFGDRMTAYKAGIAAGVITKEWAQSREAGVPVEGTPAASGGQA